MDETGIKSDRADRSSAIQPCASASCAEGIGSSGHCNPLAETVQRDVAVAECERARFDGRIKIRWDVIGSSALTSRHVFIGKRSNTVSAFQTGKIELAQCQPFADAPLWAARHQPRATARTTSRRPASGPGYPV